VAFQAVFGAQTQPVMSGVYGGGVGGSAAEELGVVGESAAADAGVEPKAEAKAGSPHSALRKVISEAEAKALVMATDPHIRKRAVADHPNWGMMSWTARLALCRAANDGTACTTAPEEAGAASVDAPKGKEGTKKEKAEAAVAAKAQKAADVAAKKEKAVQAKAKKAADAKAVKEAAGMAKAAAKEARKSKARASLSSAAAGAAGSVVRTPVRVEAGEMEQLRLSDRLRV
jgi:colicin import membrane protein